MEHVEGVLDYWISRCGSCNKGVLTYSKQGLTRPVLSVVRTFPLEASVHIDQSTIPAGEAADLSERGLDAFDVRVVRPVD